MKLCCYETGGAYAVAAIALVKAAKTLGLSMLSYTRQHQQAWWQNVAYKPRVILQTLQKYDEPVLYVDADCQLVGDPSGLESELGAADILVRHNAAGSREPYNIGVMLFANTANARRLVRGWADLTDQYCHRYETVDQAVFMEALTRWPVVIGKLPNQYNVLSSDLGSVNNPILLHNKFSRDDAALSSWKTERLLERAAIANLEVLLNTPAPEVTYLVDRNRVPPIGCEASLYTINRGDTVPCTASWFDDVTAFMVELEKPRAQFTVAAADGAHDNTCQYLRQHYKPKPHVHAMPRTMTLYYAVPGYVGERGELCGTAWTAAIHSVKIRGGKSVIVQCPDGVRVPVTRMCAAMDLQLRLE